MLFLLYINGIPDYLLCIVTIYADDTIFYCDYEQVLDLWQQMEVASELESDLETL